MKSRLFLILFFFVITKVAIAQKDQSGLGDVRYSILPPDAFIAQNDSGWVLMDGRDIRGSDLHACCGITQIPDARGMFIRGLSLKRNDGKEDPYPKENNDTARNVGSYQPDQFQSHTHSLTFAPATGDGNNTNELNFSNEAVGRKNKIGTNFSGGTETRPKNIALYIYIKINK